MVLAWLSSGSTTTAVGFNATIAYTHTTHGHTKKKQKKSVKTLPKHAKNRLTSQKIRLRGLKQRIAIPLDGNRRPPQKNGSAMALNCRIELGYIKRKHRVAGLRSNERRLTEPSSDQTGVNCCLKFKKMQRTRAFST